MRIASREAPRDGAKKKTAYRSAKADQADTAPNCAIRHSERAVVGRSTGLNREILHLRVIVTGGIPAVNHLVHKELIRGKCHHADHQGSEHGSAETANSQPRGERGRQHQHDGVDHPAGNEKQEKSDP